MLQIMVCCRFHKQLEPIVSVITSVCSDCCQSRHITF